LVLFAGAVGACGSDSGGDESLLTGDAASPEVQPSNTLPELDGVVLTVPADDFSGEVVVIDESGVREGADSVAESLDAEDSDDDSGSSTAAEDSSDQSDGGSEASDDPPERNPLGGDDPEDKLMPDVLCMGLQDAQDEIQDRGVFFSKSVDATGEGRRQLWDRNWIVVDQDPAPGTPIGENEAVLSVVKKDEDSGC